MLMTAGLFKLAVVPIQAESASPRPSFDRTRTVSPSNGLNTGVPTVNHTTIGRGARAAVCMHIDRLAQQAYWLFEAKKFAKGTQLQRWSFVT